jgi:hypothetical protein
MSDPFANEYQLSLTAPANEHYTISPSDTVDLPVRPRAIYVQADGNAVLQSKSGVNVTYAVTAGQLLTIRPTRVLEEGTTAELIAWY